MLLDAARGEKLHRTQHIISNRSLGSLSFHEDEVHGQDEADECRQVVPVQRFALEEQGGEDGEDDERHYLLDDFELHQREGAAVAGEADAVGRNLAGILEEGDAPREEDDGKQGPMGGNLHLLQLQVTVPGEGHEDVGDDEQENGVESFHIVYSYEL